MALMAHLPNVWSDFWLHGWLRYFVTLDIQEWRAAYIQEQLIGAGEEDISL